MIVKIHNLLNDSVIERLEGTPAQIEEGLRRLYRGPTKSIPWGNLKEIIDMINYRFSTIYIEVQE